jgi:large subunit ribosomal protein L15
MLRLNTLAPAPGARKDKTRVGRGTGSGLGKTCGRGHKGQKARSGGYHKVGFEGGQMPLQRRLPKFGFTSALARTRAELRLEQFRTWEGEVVTVDLLRKAGLIKKEIRSVKVFLKGEIHKPLTFKGIKITVGAKKAIEAAGGQVHEE